MSVGPIIHTVGAERGKAACLQVNGAREGEGDLPALALALGIPYPKKRHPLDLKDREFVQLAKGLGWQKGCKGCQRGVKRLDALFQLFFGGQKQEAQKLVFGQLRAHYIAACKLGVGVQVSLKEVHALLLSREKLPERHCSCPSKKDREGSSLPVRSLKNEAQVVMGLQGGKKSPMPLGYIDQPYGGSCKSFHWKGNLSTFQAVGALQVRGAANSRAGRRRLQEVRAEEKLHRQLFLQEVPNVLPLYSYEEKGLKGGRYLLELETRLMNGGDLVEWDAFNAVISPSCAKKLCLMALVATLECLGGMHELGFLHRDIKPDNLLAEINKKGELKKVYVCDFGFSASEQENIRLNCAVGTDGYLAPELLRGEKGTKEMDLFAVGATAYAIRYQVMFPPVDEEELRLWAENPTRQKNLEMYCANSGQFRSELDELDLFLLSLMDPNPKKRPSAKEARNRAENWLNKL